MDENDLETGIDSGNGFNYPAHWISKLQCMKGFINFVQTADAPQTGVNQPAFRCGLATVLTYLCMKDDHIHGKAGFEDWDVLEKLEGKTIARDLKPLLENHCKKNIYLDNAATDPITLEPNNAGKAYLYAGIDAGYEQLYTVSSLYIGKRGPIHDTGCKPKVHSFTTYQMLMYGNWGDGDGNWDYRKLVRGRWHFCLPKKS